MIEITEFDMNPRIVLVNALTNISAKITNYHDDIKEFRINLRLNNVLVLNTSLVIYPKHSTDFLHSISSGNVGTNTIEMSVGETSIKETFYVFEPTIKDVEHQTVVEILDRIKEDRGARLVVRDANNIIVYTIQMEEVR